MSAHLIRCVHGIPLADRCQECQNMYPSHHYGEVQDPKDENPQADEDLRDDY